MSTLLFAVSAADSVMQLDQPPPERYTVDSEAIVVTGRGPGGLVTVQRGADGTTPASHAAGTALLEAPLGGGGGSSVPDPSTGNVGDVPTVNAGQDAYELAAPSGGGNQRAVVNLTAAQIRTLNTVAVEVVPAPGAGKVNWPKEWLWQYTFVSVAYDSAIVHVRWTGSTTYDLGTEQGFNLNSPISRVGSQPLVGYFEDDADAENKAIEVFAKSNQGVLGDGTMRLIVEYEIVTLA